MWDCLPDDVFTEKILLTLPIKTILQCSCVCKSWRSLITSPDFISTHLLRCNIKTKTAIFLQQLEENIGRFLFLFDNQDHFRPMSLHLPHRSVGDHTVGSVNGLICISIGQSDHSVHRVRYYILFNPSIRRSFSIPPPPDHRYEAVTAEGFGFDETTRDYKILFMVTKYCFIYSLNSNSWRRLVNPPPLLNSSLWSYLRNSVFTNGGIHWAVIEQVELQEAFKFIMVFDIKGETFRRISLPEHLAKLRSGPASSHLNMVELGESSIGVIEPGSCWCCRNGPARIWVLKEYGEVESWIKLVSVNTIRGNSIVLGFRNKGEMLIRCRYSGCIASINVKSKVKPLIYLCKRDPFSFSNVYKYAPNLALLDKPNNVDVRVDVDVDIIAARSHQEKEERRRKRRGENIRLMQRKKGRS